MTTGVIPPLDRIAYGQPIKLSEIVHHHPFARVAHTIGRRRAPDLVVTKTGRNSLQLS
jgi:hypothetical protein